MNFIDNNYHIGKDDIHEGVPNQINTSFTLDEIAYKLTDRCLSENAFCYISKDNKNKTKYPHLITAINTVFWLLKSANNRPVFMVINGYDWEMTDGFYFFIGLHDSIKEKLIKLSEDRLNCKE